MEHIVNGRVEQHNGTEDCSQEKPVIRHQTEVEQLTGLQQMTENAMEDNA
jgi:hypothetical protein